MGPIELRKRHDLLGCSSRPRVYTHDTRPLDASPHRIAGPVSRGPGIRSAERQELNVRKARDWPKVIDQLNKSPRGELTIRMGSPGSAQVTRVRLLAEWNHLEATTKGATLRLRLK